MLQDEMKILTREIDAARDRLRKAARKLEDAQGNDTMHGMDLTPISAADVRDILQRTDPSKT